MRYPILEGELRRRGLTRQKIADDFNLALSTVSLRLSGRSDMPLSFAKGIKEKYKIAAPLDVLYGAGDDVQGV